MAFRSSARICLVLALMRFLRMACGALSVCVVRPAPRGWDWPSRDSESVKPFVDGPRHAMLRAAQVSVLAVLSHSGPCGSRSAPRCTAVRRTAAGGACSEVCSRTIKNVWSTGAILSHSKRLNHSWPGPVKETCRTLRKRQLTHEVPALSALCHVPARRRAASAGAVRFAKMHSWQTATSLIALAQIRILQDQANFHIDGEGTMRGAENDPSLDDLA
jgi:hypothetical protein